MRQRLAHIDDVRAQVAFQNDVNALIAAVGDLEVPRSRLPNGIEAASEILPVQPLSSLVGARAAGRARAPLAGVPPVGRMRDAGRSRARSA
ncbi:MAG TPA: hypothetical protein VMU50_22745 [Polyangia bacterium]|nr:hypothetical protein [Polyangia bacterium]